MAQLIITVPDDIAEEALLAISTQRGYRETTGDEFGGETEPNPQTRVAFIKQTIINDLKRDFKKYKVRQSRIEEQQINVDAEELINVIN